MLKMLTRKQWATLGLLFCLGFAACQQERESNGTTAEAPTLAAPAATAEATEPAASAEDNPAEPTAAPDPTDTPIPTPTAMPAKELRVCGSVPPQDLYLYGDTSITAVGLRQAIYESPIASRAFGYQPQGLTELPTEENGGVRFEAITVDNGDRVVDAQGELITLQNGAVIRLANGEVVEFGGPPVEMEQMVIDFTFQPLVWSDGEPVTADDSVFSFQVAADRSTLRDKSLIERTANYTAEDEHTVRWVGLPGQRNSNYLANLWEPLPRHQLGGYTPLQLHTQPEAAQTPLSSGPFVVEAWEEEQITLVRNPHYYRSAEGLPRVDRLIVAFLGDEDPLAALADGRCDIVTSDAVNPALAAEAPAGANIVVHPSAIYEQIAFGVNSLGRQALRRPDWFEDARVRQALTQCTDRAAIAAAAGSAAPMPAYVPADHPLLPADAAVWNYDPATANALLDEVGYLDTNGDGIREDIESGKPFSVTLNTTASEVRLVAAEMFAAQVADCGVQVNVVETHPVTMFDTGPNGPIFGRNFDLALMGWALGVAPDCQLYTRAEISGPVEEGFVGYNGANVTGWANRDFDAACTAAQQSLYGTAAFTENHAVALRLFTTELPAIPLFARVKVAVTSPAVQNFALDTTQPSDWWNAAEWDIEK